jgi:alkanesulfonate monooxygenase SsuD/methylene tetrahydromethanopterin reductase-like flavin-dependent oxidoreductase (luciferase family)
MGQAFNRYMLPLLTRNLPGGLLTFKDDPDMPDSDVTVEYLANNVWIVGSPETVTEKLDKLRDEQGKFGTLLVVAHDWADRPRAINSLKLLANKVRPALAD